MRALLLAALVLHTSIAVCQSGPPPTIVRSVPISQEIEFRSGYGDLRVACGADGTFIMPLVVELDKAGIPLVRMTANGAIVARMDVEVGVGLGPATVLDFAIAPSGESYVLAKKVVTEEIERDVAGKAKSVQRDLENSLWVVRFSPKGDYLSKIEVLLPINALYANLNVLPSGRFLVTATDFSFLRSQSRAPRPKPAAHIFIINNDGSSAELEWPKLEEEGLYRPDRVDEPMTAAGSVWVARLGKGNTSSFLYVLREDGSIGRAVRLNIPPDTTPVMPRVWDRRLLISLQSAQNPVPGTRFVEMDTETGKAVADYSFPTPGVQPICYSSAGAMFIDGPKGMINFVRPTAH
jgi:hypothetical protein